MKKLLFVLLALLALSLPNTAKAANPASLPVVASISALKALGAASAQYKEVHVSSYLSGGSRGGGDFNWSPASTATTNVCTIFQATGVTTGRWIREFHGSTVLDVTMCGARWDDQGDDSAAINAALALAGKSGAAPNDPGAVNNYQVTCPAGSGQVLSTIVLQIGVHLSCMGMGQSTIQANAVAGACMQLLLPSNTTQDQAPELDHFSLKCGGTYGIQINSTSSSFCDTPGCTDYAMRPSIHDVKVIGGSAAGIYCAKCFDGAIYSNYITNNDEDFSHTLGDGIYLHGSDWMVIGGDGGSNRVIGSTSWSIITDSVNSFGNGCKISHNDLLLTTGISGLIYTNCISFSIEFNFLESPNGISCDIIVASGALQGTVTKNVLSSTPATNWYCQSTNLAQIAITDNQTTNPPAQGVALFPTAYPVYYNSVTRATVTHSGNWDDTGYPFNVQGSPNIPTGGAVIDYTPSSALTFTSADNGTNITVNSNPAADSYGAWDIPPGDTVDFPLQTPTVPGTYAICFISAYISGTATIQPYDGASTIGSPVSTSITAAGRYCPAGLASITATSNLTWTLKNTGGSDMYIKEIYAK